MILCGHSKCHLLNLIISSFYLKKRNFRQTTQNHKEPLIQEYLKYFIYENEIFYIYPNFHDG